MAASTPDIQSLAVMPDKPHASMDLTDALIEAMNKTMDALVRAGARSKSIDQKRLAWEVIRYLRQEVKDSKGLNSNTGDLAKSLAALMPASQVNVQVNVDGDERERHRLAVKAETGLTAAIRDRAANQLAKLDASRANQQLPASTAADQATTDQQQTEPIQAAEKLEG